MSIRSASIKGIRDIRVSSDNLVLISMLLVLSLSRLPSSLIAAVLFVLLIAGIAGLAARVKMSRTKAKCLNNTQAPILMNILHEEAELLGVSKYYSASRRPVYCAPTVTQATAFILGGVRSKLVVTGRLCVKASSSPDEVRLILRHELAHFHNHDTWLWQLLIVYMLGIVISPVFLLREPRALPGLIASVIWLFYIFIRREYMADAMALNHTEKRSEYLTLLQSASNRKNGWFHPDYLSRMGALQTDNPVLRANVVFVLFIFVTFGQNAAMLFVYPTEFGERVAPLSTIIALIVSSVILFIAFVKELSKGARRKIPLALTEQDRVPLPRYEYLSPLAKLFGVGESRVDYPNAIAAVMAISAGGIAEAWFNHLRSVRSYGVEGSQSSTGWGIVDFLLALLASCVLLAALRYTRSVVEAGACYAVAGVVQDMHWLSHQPFRASFSWSISSLAFWRDLSGESEFVLYTIFSVVLLNFFLARVRGDLRGLFVGYMSGQVSAYSLSLLSAFLTWVITPNTLFLSGPHVGLLLASLLGGTMAFVGVFALTRFLGTTVLQLIQPSGASASSRE